MTIITNTPVFPKFKLPTKEEFFLAVDGAYSKQHDTLTQTNNRTTTMPNETVKWIWTAPGAETINTNPASINIQYFDKKHDKNKLRWDLVSLPILESLATILTYGAEKYAPNSWQDVPKAEHRYFAAMMRHLERYQSGEYLDKESGHPHLWHALCNVYFLVYLEGRRKRNTKSKGVNRMAQKAKKAVKKVAKKK
jgi:hypothetical protein